MYYIVNTETWFPYATGRPYPMAKTFATEAGAKGTHTRQKKKGKMTGPEWEVMSVAEWEERRPMRKVKNLMSGKMVDEKAGTPGYLSVASERYWSM